MDMRLFRPLLLCTCLALPGFCLASWQVGGKPTRTHGSQPQQMVAGTPKDFKVNPHYTLKVSPGLLHTIVYNYASQQHNWHLKWKLSKSLRNNQQAVIAGPDFKQVLNKFLANFPVKAHYNVHSHTVTVTSSR